MGLLDRIIFKYMEDLCDCSTFMSISNVTRLSDEEIICDVTINDENLTYEETKILFTNYYLDEEKKAVFFDTVIDFPLESHNCTSSYDVDYLFSKCSPTPESIKKERLAIGFTQEEAGNLIYKNIRTWQRYEYGKTAMDPAFFELFKAKSLKFNDHIIKLTESFAEDYLKIYETNSNTTKHHSYRINSKTWVSMYQESDQEDFIIHTLQIIDVDINTSSAYVIETEKKGNEDLIIFKGRKPLDLNKL